MEFHLCSDRYTIRKLDEADTDRILELMRGNAIFYQYHPPRATKQSILADMNALPPRKCAADKYYVGFFDGTSLIAILDLILAYPEEDIAWIGFFMTDVHVQGRGVGSEIIREVCACLQASGYRKIRLGVDRGNPQSYAFWSKNQFHLIGEAEYLLMERS